MPQNLTANDVLRLTVQLVIHLYACGNLTLCRKPFGEERTAQLPSLWTDELFFLGLAGGITLREIREGESYLCRPRAIPRSLGSN